MESLALRSIFSEPRAAVQFQQGHFRPHARRGGRFGNGALRCRDAKQSAARHAAIARTRPGCAGFPARRTARRVEAESHSENQLRLRRHQRRAGAGKGTAMNDFVIHAASYLGPEGFGNDQTGLRAWPSPLREESVARRTGRSALVAAVRFRSVAISADGFDVPARFHGGGTARREF